LRAAGIAATRQLAKRQITWLRSTPATFFDPFASEPASAILREVARALDPRSAS
jgi:tRNA A37 N6-isopentenylltransferase MiaA